MPDSSENGALCGECQNRQRPYTQVTAPYLYQGEIQRLHQGFKFNRKLAAGRLLSELLCDSILASNQRLPELLIPVPLHLSRIRQRGYNQSTELARILSRRLNTPVDQFYIKRNKATEPQAGLSKKERIENIKGAFSLQHSIEASHVAVIDDVMTTGMTIEQVAKVLRKEGVRKIDVWVIARRP